MIYKPLNSDPVSDPFRLLLLQPSADVESQIVCTLEHASIAKCRQDSIEPYISLSYVWGNIISSTPIFVDDYPLQITRNLECALRSIRDDSRIVRLWIDAICINQVDPDEKAAQVQQMGSIYRCAYQTIIYLGESDERSEYIFGQVNAMLDPNTDHGVDWDADKFNDVVTHWHWFERVWVLQELVVSRDPWIQCGRQKIQWESLFHLEFASIDRKVRQAKILGTSGPESWVTKMQNIRECFQLTKPTYQKRPSTHAFWSTMLDVLVARRGMKAKQCLDMIYAHLGIATGCGSMLLNEVQQEVKVDYTVSKRQLYINVAKSLYAEGGRILGMVEEEDPSVRVQRNGLPSWVPDWTVHRGHKWHTTRDDLDRLHGQDEAAILTEGDVQTPELVHIGTEDLCVLKQPEFGIVTAIGQPLDLSVFSHKENVNAWDEYFPHDFDKQDLCPERSLAVFKGYIQYMGLPDTIWQAFETPVDGQTPLQRDKACLNRALSLNNIYTLPDQQRTKIHPFTVIALIHLHVITWWDLATPNLSEGFEEWHSAFQGRRFCAIKPKTNARFDFSYHTGLAPGFVKVDDEIHLLEHHIHRPPLFVAFRRDENGDVAAVDGGRSILVGKCHFFVQVPIKWLGTNLPTIANERLKERMKLKESLSQE